MTIYALKFLKRAKNQEHIRFSPCLKLDLHFPCDHWDACKPATAYGPLWSSQKSRLSQKSLQKSRDSAKPAVCHIAFWCLMRLSFCQGKSLSTSLKGPIDWSWRRASRPVCESSFFGFLFWLRWGGVGGACWRSLALASWLWCFVTDGVGWGGVGHVDVRLHLRHDFDASWRMGWGGVGWGMLTFACTCVMTLMLRDGWGGVGWGWGMLTFACTCVMTLMLRDALLATMMMMMKIMLIMPAAHMPLSTAWPDWTAAPRKNDCLCKVPKRCTRSQAQHLPEEQNSKCSAEQSCFLPRPQAFPGANVNARNLQHLRQFSLCLFRHYSCRVKPTPRIESVALCSFLVSFPLYRPILVMLLHLAFQCGHVICHRCVWLLLSSEQIASFDVLDVHRTRRPHRFSSASPLGQSCAIGEIYFCHTSSSISSACRVA